MYKEIIDFARKNGLSPKKTEKEVPLLLTLS